MALDTESTIIIPVRNNGSEIRRCLRSIVKGTIIPEIFVLDNGSTDDTEKILQKEFPEVHHVKLGANTGRAHAVNTGIHLTRTPYCIVFSPEVRVGKHCVESLLRTAKQHPEAYGVQATVLHGKEPATVLSAGLQMDAAGRVSRCDRMKRRVSKVQAVGLEACLLNMEILFEIGIFDERYYGILEDLDLGVRAQLLGYTGVCDPHARVQSPESLFEMTPFYKKVTVGNLVYLLYMNMPDVQYRINARVLKGAPSRRQGRIAEKLGMTSDELENFVLRGKEMCLNAELEVIEADQGASVTKRPLPEEFCMDVTDEKVNHIYPLFLGTRRNSNLQGAFASLKLQGILWLKMTKRSGMQL